MEEKEVKFNLFTDENKNVCITSDIEEFEDYVTVEEEYYILMHIISDLAKKAVNADLYNKDIKIQKTKNKKQKKNLKNCFS